MPPRPTRRIERVDAHGLLRDHSDRLRALEAIPPPPGFYEIKVFADDQLVTTGDGKFYFAIPEDLDEYWLYRANAFLSTVGGGITQVQIRNTTTGLDMLSTRIQIDAGEVTSYSGTPGVPNVANSQVSTADLLRIDVDSAGSGSMGLGVMLRFWSFEYGYPS